MPALTDGGSSPALLVYSAQMETVGGIESHVLEFCERFAAKGWRVTLMSSRFADNPRAVRRLRDARVELIVNTSSWTSATPLRKWLWTLVALARLGPRRFDAVYVNGQGRNPATVHARYRGRAHTVHHHHTSCDAADVASWPPSYRDALRRCNTLVVCADFIRERMRRASGRDDVDVAYCFSRRIDAPDRRSGTSSVVFGYFGRLIAEKGIDWILRLSRDPRLADVEWLIWGAESQAYRARDFEGYSSVTYLGPFAGDEGLRAALQALDCYCLFSSHPEGLPVSLMEAMSAGRPWIATPQGGVPELAHDPASCVLVTLDDYEAVVAACGAMRDRLRAGAVDFARQRAFYTERLADEPLYQRWCDVLGTSVAPR
jgi:glycosyltransferase involved in cell wall biosynthesis